MSARKPERVDLSLSVALRFAARHASQDETRPHLQQIVVEPTRAYATDGHRMIVLNVNAIGGDLGTYDLHGRAIKDPARPTPIDQVIPDPETPIVVTFKAGDLRTRCDLIKPRTVLCLSFEPSPVLKVTEVLSQAQERKRTKAREFDMPLAGPDARRNFGVNARYLLEAFEDLGFADDTEVELRQRKDLDPIRIDSCRGTAVIMPMKV